MAETPEEGIRAMLIGSDQTAAYTMSILCRLLGATVRNVVLTYGALGDVFLAGGILPLIEESFKHGVNSRRTGLPNERQSYSGK